MATTLRSLAFPLTLLFIAPALGQISHGGTPIGLMPKGPSLPTPAQITLPTVDGAALIAEDEARYADGVVGPWRFGFNHDVAFSNEAHGTWSTLRNGDRLWRLAIECPGAYAINFRFSRYELPERARVFVYNDQGEHLGAFTRANASTRNSLGVGQLPGERITIEYHAPASAAGQGRLEIDRVTHAYRDPLGYSRGLGDSGDCNINVICPEGDDWRDQIRSVAIITTGGNGFCTGTILNNCAEDSIPYFLTASHCLSPDVEEWVFRFNWDSPDCDPTADWPTLQTVSGCVLLASSTNTDMAFLELNDIPPADYNVFYAGWDKSGTTPTSVCGIHHPSGDIKKISLSNSPILQDNVDLGTGAADCWHVTAWDAGTTEPGSSGSALFDQNKRVVGQLYGGAADCSNSVDDYYGRLDVSWPLLEAFLGGCGDTLNGLGENVVPTVYDAAITSIVNIPALICGDSIISPIVTLKNNGLVVMTSCEITYGLIGGTPYTFNWTGSLQVLQTFNQPLPPIVASTGSNTLYVTVAWPNANADQVPENDTWYFSFNVSNPGGTVELQLTLDNWGSDITWQLATQLGDVLYTGGPYADLQAGEVITASFCLTNDCYVFTIDDAFGDGICCDEGEGSYVIMNADSTMLVESDGQYGEQDVQTFCVEVVGVDELAAQPDASVFPNPARDQVIVRSTMAMNRLRVHDATGRVMLDVQPASTQHAFDTDGFAAGSYLVITEMHEGRSVKRLVVQ